MLRLSTLATVLCACAALAPISSAFGSTRGREALLARHDATLRPLNASSTVATLDKRATKCTKASDCPAVSNGKGVCTAKRCAIQCNANRELNAKGTNCVAIVPTTAPIANDGKSCSSDARCRANLPANAVGKCVKRECEVSCASGYTSTRGTCIMSLPLDDTKCRKDSDCGAGVANAYGVCSQRVCQLYCKTGYQLLNGACLAAPAKPTSGAAGCKVDTDCPAKGNGYAVCSSGKCAFVCLATFKLQNGKCVPTTEACTTDGSCPDGPTNSHLVGYCNTATGHCTTQCAQGFTPSNGACKATPTECTSGPCKPVTGGYSVCSNNACLPQCYGGQGYQLFCGDTSCQCINMSNDPDNCGGKGVKCPATYNGLGTRVCKDGACDVDCGSLGSMTTSSGVKYCKPQHRR